MHRRAARARGSVVCWPCAPRCDAPQADRSTTQPGRPLIGPADPAASPLICYQGGHTTPCTIPAPLRPPLQADPRLPASQAAPPVHQTFSSPMPTPFWLTTPGCGHRRAGCPGGAARSGGRPRRPARPPPHPRGRWPGSGRAASWHVSFLVRTQGAAGDAPERRRARLSDRFFGLEKGGNAPWARGPDRLRPSEPHLHLRAIAGAIRASGGQAIGRICAGG